MFPTFINSQFKSMGAQPICSQCQQTATFNHSTTLTPQQRQILNVRDFKHSNIRVVSEEQRDNSWTTGEQEGDGDRKKEFTGKRKEYYGAAWHYEGDFVNGVRQGFGKMVWPNGSFYKGRFIKGTANGLGTFHHFSGVQYIGQFVNDQLILGKRISPNRQEIYEGGFKSHTFQGYGKLTIKNTFYYEGFFRNNQMHGQGYIKYNDESEYTGMFVDGRKEGFGVWSKAGEKYQGEWLGGQRHGQGIFIDAEEGRYRCNYDRGKELPLS